MATFRIGNRYGRYQTELLSADGTRAVAVVWTHREIERDQIVEDADGIAILHLFAAIADPTEQAAA